MSTMFDKYDVASNDASDSIDKTKCQPAIDQKAVKQLKKVLKQLRKQNKLLKQIRKHRVEEEPSKAEKSVASKEGRPKTAGREEKPFLSKLGDVSLKTLPRILTYAASAVVTAIIGRVFKRNKTPRRATI